MSKPTANIDIITKITVNWKREFIDNGVDFYVKMSPRIRTTVELGQDSINQIKNASGKAIVAAFHGKTIKAKK